MRLALWQNNKIKCAIVLMLGVVIGQLTPLLWTWAVMLIAEPAYQEATYRCDRAMREHLLAKQKLNATPSLDNVRSLEASEIALIDCQDYDLLRKRLKLLGLNDAALSYMALRAIEAKAKDLQEVVEIHEIRR